MNHFYHLTTTYDTTNMIAFRNQYGMEGYGIYWAVLEIMAREPNAILAKTIFLYQVLATRLNVEEEKITKIVATLLELEILKQTDKYIYSEEILEFKNNLERISETNRTNILRRYSGNTTVEESKLQKEIQKETPIYKDIIDYLNKKTGKHFQYTEATFRKIHAKLHQKGTSYNKEDFYYVIDVMCDKWGNDQKFKEYLRPETLFSSKFESYRNIISISKVSKYPRDNKSYEIVNGKRVEIE